MFGIFMALFGGIGIIGHSVSQSLEDEKYRDRARAKGDEYYFAHDGERRVSDNHKIARGNYGIIDATTGNYIVDNRELERQKERKIKEENRVSKQEAIIKGEETYTWDRVNGKEGGPLGIGILRLVKNDMPIENHSSEYEWYEGQKFIEKAPCIRYDKNGKNFIPNYHYIYKLYEEKNFSFKCPIQYTEQEIENINNNSIYKNIKDYQVPDEGWKDITDKCKKDNIAILVHWINIRPINQIKWMHQYCFKYDIPMGTWEEVEQACWKEHPVRWGKPEEELWSFKKWFLSVYDY